MSQLFICRLLLGVGEAVIAPASLRWIRMNIDEKQRGLAMGIYMAGTKIGPAIGAPIAAFLIAAYGWRAMFLVTGLASLIWLIPWLTSRSTGSRHRTVARAERVRKPRFRFWRCCGRPRSGAF